jgi:hypothetical protein
MARGTRSRTPGKDDEKRKLLTSLKPSDFPSLVADILYFSKGHRLIRVMDGPGDGCRDIQSADKDNVTVLTQCKCFADPEKVLGSPDANELVVALTKFGRTRGILATTGRYSPQLKREFTDSFPALHLDWLDGADIADEVFSNPALHRAWVNGTSVGRATFFVKIPFVVRRARDDASLEQKDQDLNDGLSIEHACLIDLGALERFRPPETVSWTESIGPKIWSAGLLSRHPPDLHALESLHGDALQRAFGSVDETLIVRFGTPYLAPTKSPDFDKSMRLPGFAPRSYVLTPNATPRLERDFITLSLPDWRFPKNLSMLEADWGNWQTADNQRWCHIVVHAPAFPGSNSAFLSRMIDASKRRDWKETGAVFTTATREVCGRIVEACTFEPDVRCENGPGGELLGWTFEDSDTRQAEQTIVHAVLATEPSAQKLTMDDAIAISSRSDTPLVPVPGGEAYYPAQLMFDFDDLPSPHYLKDRSCVFVEFWKLPCDVPTAEAALDKIVFDVPEGWKIWVVPKRGPSTNQTFPMVSVSTPWPLHFSTNEVVTAMQGPADDVFRAIGKQLQSIWPDARCATAEFWETEIHSPPGVYIETEQGWVRDDWKPDEVEEGDD